MVCDTVIDRDASGFRIHNIKFCTVVKILAYNLTRKFKIKLEVGHM